VGVRARAVLVAAVTLLASACGFVAAPRPTATPSLGVVPFERAETPPASLLSGPGPPPATLPPTPLDPGPAPGVFVPPSPTAPPLGAERARAEVDRVLAGQLREEMRSLLAVAAETGDEAQRYQAYLGAWQHLRDAFFAAGQPPAYRPVLDAVHEVARGFPQYAAGQFELRPT
jgi:hypothetical protein